MYRAGGVRGLELRTAACKVSPSKNVIYLKTHFILSIVKYMNTFTDLLLETFWNKNYNSTLFGVLFEHNAHFLILSLQCVLMSLLMRIVWSWNNVFKCKIFKVYQKYTYNSSTLAHSNILKYIFSWTSVLLLHSVSALSPNLFVPIYQTLSIPG